MRRVLPVLILAALAAACTPPAVTREPPAGAASAGPGPAPVPRDPYQVLVAALRSGQAPLEAQAAETFLETGLKPPRDDLQRLGDAGDPRVRLVALTVLGRTWPRESVGLFRRRLGDPMPVVRLAAAYGLAMAGDPGHVEMLRDGLASPDVTQRRTAAWLLGLMGRTSATGMLETALADPDAVVVLRAAEALDRLGSRAGREPVRRLLGHQRHEVRYFAARLLGRIGTTEDIPRLERLCVSKVFLDVKFAAIAALARLGDLKRITLLLEMVAGPDGQMRLLAARALGEAGYAPAKPALTKLLATAPGLQEQTVAAAALVKVERAGRDWRKGALSEEPASR